MHSLLSWYFVGLLFIQPLGWFVTKIPVGSCSFGIAWQFRILHGGNVLLYGNTARQGGYIFPLPIVCWTCMLCWYNRQCNLMAYQSTLVFHQHQLFGWECSCSFFFFFFAEKKEASPQSLLGSYVKDKFYKQTKPVPPHNTYTPQPALASNCYCVKLWNWQVPLPYILLPRM
jgi:hypothetical protein